MVVQCTAARKAGTPGGATPEHKVEGYRFSVQVFCDNHLSVTGSSAALSRSFSEASYRGVCSSMERRNHQQAPGVLPHEGCGGRVAWIDTIKQEAS
ncbi:hypothetical protein E2C01_064788 [Portunus trituberculatus]|uniref:Uncharacterized protein n=1 Tax=Portunus trituberculatus TaxID=210409 RepID=A0A5B7HMU4_PORTR|nr:hypothetical protein [Portunus trituberculatus]